MRTNIEIDDTLMAEAQKACGKTTKLGKRTVGLRHHAFIRRDQ